jgi:hypothetical protein
MTPTNQIDPAEGTPQDAAEDSQTTYKPKLAIGSPEFMERLRKQFSTAMAQENDIRDEAAKDIRFRAGDQWPEADKATREANKRPVEVFNKIPQFVASVVNEGRKNKATIKFSPVDDLADPDTATVCEELARAIQYNSDADVAYECALDPAVGSSFGYFRMITKYCDNDTDDQEIAFVPVLDPMSVCGVMIPSAFKRVVPFAFVSEKLSKEEFERDNPDSKLTNDWALNSQEKGQDFSYWVESDQVRVAEYWWVEWERSKTASGRVVQIPHVWSCKTNGVEVFKGSETEWAGSTIPIWAVLGGQLVVDGKLQLYSVPRFIRAPQITINFSKNRVLETLAIAPISPFIGPAGYKLGREAEWDNLNKRLTSAIEYNVVDQAGHALPPPNRQVWEPPIGALSNFIAQEEEDLKSGSGVYATRLGGASNETSGIAIQRRNTQSETLNFHYLDNLTRAQKEAGRALAEIMPKIYDTPRWVRIIGKDETERMARINEEYTDKETGQKKVFMVGAGKYDVRVISGASFTTKRQETAELLAGALQAAPQLMGVIGDLYFRNLDAAGSDQMAERMKKWISAQSPGLIEDEKGGQPEIPPQVQQAMQQMQQQVQQAQQQLQALDAYGKQKEQEIQALQAKLDSKEPEIASRERIESAKIDLEREKLQIEREKIQAQIGIEEFKAGIKANVEELYAELERVKTLAGHDQADMDRQHQMEMAAQNRDQMALEFQPQDEGATELPTEQQPQAEEVFR